MRTTIATSILAFACAAALSQVREESYAIGVSVVGPRPSCPIFVANVSQNSPAADAGIKAGDRLITVDGSRVTTVREAAERLRSEAGDPVTLHLVRGERPYSVTVRRERLATMLRKNGRKMVDEGVIVPLDATDAEIKRILSFDPKRIIERVFPTHYPEKEQLYYPGFEVFVLDSPREIAVGGIEDSPAARAGVHWGDVILGIDGIDPRNKSAAELERLLTSSRPRRMTLTVDRAGFNKTFSFDLAQAATVLRDNQLQMLKGQPIPLGIPQQYLSCFE